MPASSDPARLALGLAALGWHILPLSPVSKRPLANCPACRPQHGIPAHLAHACPCLAAGGWCHGVRAATTDPGRITTWWQREPRAVPGVAAGPLRAGPGRHRRPRRPAPAHAWPPACCPASTSPPNPSRAMPGTTRAGSATAATPSPCWPGSAAAPDPWPAGPEHQPVTAATPSGGVHLWYQAPAPNLRQALADPAGRYGLAWQIDLKAGWSYGIAPGAATTAGTYPIRGGDPAQARPHAQLARPRGHPRHHHSTTPARHPAAATVSPAGPARPPTWPPSSTAAPSSSPP